MYVPWDRDIQQDHDRCQTAHQRDDCEHRDMLEWLKATDEWSAQSYGSCRMQKALNGLGYPVTRNKGRQWMREAEIGRAHV